MSVKYLERYLSDLSNRSADLSDEPRSESRSFDLPWSKSPQRCFYWNCSTKYDAASNHGKILGPHIETMKTGPFI